MNPDSIAVPARNQSKLDAKYRLFTVVVIAIWIAICISAPLIYKNSKNGLDDSGWIEHSHDTPVWIEGDWLSGEYRVCEMPGYLWGRLPETAHLLCSSGDPRAEEGIWFSGFRDSLSTEEYNQVSSGSWSGLEHHFHILPVKYWGRIDRRDRTGFSWRCQKETDALECKAIN